MPKANESASLEPKAQGKRPVKKDPFDNLKPEDCKPWDFDKASLPNDHVEFQTIKNADGQDVTIRHVWSGEPRFYLEVSHLDGKRRFFNLVGVYRNGKGVGRRNLRTMKPYLAEHHDASIQDRGRKDAGILKVLKANKIPEKAVFKAS